MASKTTTTKAFSAPSAPAVGPREAEAQATLDGYLDAQTEVRERLAALRADLPLAVAERDRLDAVIGTEDEDDRAFTRLGDADTRVTSLERRISQAEAEAQQADHDVASARITVEYRRGEDLIEWLAGYDRSAVDDEFVLQIQPLFDAYQDALQERDDAEDEVRGIARRLNGTPRARVSVGEAFVQVGGVHLSTPAYQRRVAAGTVFERVIDRRADERRRQIAAEEAASVAERRAEAERIRELDMERMAFLAGGSADPSARVDRHGPGMPQVHPQMQNVSGLASGGNDRDPNAF